MNRLDWTGNPSEPVRRGEQFELDDEDRAQSLLEAGYILYPPAENKEANTSIDDIIVIDHGDDIPDASWTIADIKGWMDTKNAGYPDRASKSHLLELVERLDET